MVNSSGENPRASVREGFPGSWRVCMSSIGRFLEASKVAYDILGAVKRFHASLKAADRMRDKQNVLMKGLCVFNTCCLVQISIRTIGRRCTAVALRHRHIVLSSNAPICLPCCPILAELSAIYLQARQCNFTNDGKILDGRLPNRCASAIPSTSPALVPLFLPS
jgi:hypothetical protein